MLGRIATIQQYRSPSLAAPLHHGNMRMNITNRERGVIPGCRPAVDIYHGIEKVDADKFHDDYQEVWDGYRLGYGVGWEEWLSHPIHKRKLLSPIRQG